VGTVDMLDGLLAGITSEDIDRMPPAHTRRLAQALRRDVHAHERVGRSRPSAKSDTGEVGALCWASPRIAERPVKHPYR
jgi:hypothetical protein